MLEIKISDRSLSNFVSLLKIIKFKRQALEDEDGSVRENNANVQIENELYEEAIAKFPELSSLDKQEVLRQMKALSINRQEVRHEEEDIPTRKIFIDHVLCNDTKFNDSEVRDHVYTIVAAGSETTALQTAHTSKKLMQSTRHPSNDFIILFTYSVMLLATHPEIQEKVYEELKEVFYSDEVEISYDNINKLDLLERVIKESLRLCPVVPGKIDCATTI